ncbi:mandelate racemase/muconate lactonizing enzyme family protein [Pseudactinotalea sp.]|uniref:mandelate racemase/muconate lactonizing enzyme family protein n=1 Tax=Pseudactinotalea sp. TaxID=1926260 RepID=UPI003B3ABDDA
MKITEIVCRAIALPTRRKQRWASLTADLGAWVLIELRTDEGVVGWGEGTALAQWGGDYGRYYGETPATIRHILQTIYAPVLIGADPRDLQGVLARMDAGVRGHHYARTAVEAALLDLNARAAGIPVYQLLGGRRRDRVSIAHSIGLMPLEAVLDELELVLEEGISTIKLKVGEDRARDIEVVTRVRERCGAGIDIQVDANGGWRHAPEALRMIEAIQAAEPRFIEQPVAGIVELEQLARWVRVPLMADESAWTARDVLEISRRSAAALVSIYTSKAGGLLNAMRMDAVAQACGIGTNVNGSGESGIGNLANVHLAAAMASMTEASVFPITGLESNRPTQTAMAVYTDDLLSEPFGYVDGQVVVPDGPGWGIDIDLDKVAHYTLEEQVIR